MKIFHIVSWYPNRHNAKEALFIQRHIASLDKHVAHQEILHLNVGSGKLKFERQTTSGVLHQSVNIPISSWLLIEVIATILLVYHLVRKRVNSFDVLNFHVAYPNMTFLQLFRRWIKPKVVITEHWSAYHLNFGLKLPPPRIQRIFKHNHPVIAVSNALIQDIKLFSNATFPTFVVPNIVDTSVFKTAKEIERVSLRFFMVAQWKDPKDPFVVIKAFKKLAIEFPEARLNIGGYGPQIEKMGLMIQDTELSENIFLKGKMDPDEIAKEMQLSSAYVHCSEYETFSVVCAEAIHCGCPVIASNVGGIKEFVNSENGILIDSNDVEDFYKAMRKIEIDRIEFNPLTDFSSRSVGKNYIKVLNEIVK